MTGEQEARFRKMYEAGAPWLEIGTELGIDPSWLSVLRKRMGIPERAQKGRKIRWTDDMEADLKKKRHHMSVSGLARHFGVSVDAIKNKLHAMGVTRGATVPVDTYTGSPAWVRAQFGGDPLPPMHPIACEVLGLRA